MAQTPDNLANNDNANNYVDDYVTSNDPDVVIIAGEESAAPMGSDVLVDQSVANYAAGTPGFTGSETTNASGLNDVNTVNGVANTAGGATASGATNQNDRSDQDWSESDDTSQLRDDIEGTRSQLGQTLGAIEERLNPQRLTDQAKEVVHDATIGRAEQAVNNVEMSAKQAGNTLLDTIKENPVPAALVGIGLGWLIMKARNNAQSQNWNQNGNQNWNQGYRGQNWNQGRYGYNNYGNYSGYDGQGPYVYGYGYGNGSSGGGNAVSNAAQNVQNQASNAVNTLQDKAGQVSNQVQNAASQVGDTVQNTAGQVADTVQGTAQQVGYQAQMQAQRAQGWFEDTLQSNPLALGVIAMAAGVAAGMLIPETQPENRLMGPARDQLLDKAAGKAEDTIQKVQGVAQNVANTATTTANTASTASQATNTAAQKAKDVVERAKNSLEGNSQNTQNTQNTTSGSATR